MGDFYGVPTPMSSSSPIHDLLLEEFDSEMKKTRTLLEQVPVAMDYAPHEKSMKLRRLAGHTAELAGFGVSVMTTPELNFADGKYKPQAPETTDGLLALFDKGVAEAREALLKVSDTAWAEPWKLSYKEHVIFTGLRFLAYQQMYMNHLVHHRAQLGVYLRLNNLPVPSVYGPSADDKGM